jgi:transposase-like protein
MPLMTCIDCGASISTQVSTCPKCKSSHPSGVNCRVCGAGPFSAKRMLRNRRVIAESNFDDYYHEHCAIKLVIPARSPQCPDCNQSYAWPKLARAMEGVGNVTCAECGRSWSVQMQWPDGRELKFSFCSICGLPIYSFTGQEIIESPHNVPMFSNPCYWSAAYHPSCVTPELRAHRRDKQEQHKQREVSRKKTGFWDRFRGN